MTNNEKMRLNEIVFCNLFKRLLQMNKNPIKVYDYIAALSEVIGANTLVLNNIITIILNNDKRYMPTRKEYIWLLRRSNIPVREIISKLHISFSTYYDPALKQIPIEPKFDAIQYAEIMKILKFYIDTQEVIEGGVLLI